MLDRQRSRFKTPPESPKIEGSDKIRDEITSEVVDVIIPKTAADVLNLLRRFSEIDTIKWLTYKNGRIYLVLFSNTPHQKGRGGVEITQNEFTELKAAIDKEFQGRIKFICAT